MTIHVFMKLVTFVTFFSAHALWSWPLTFQNDTPYTINGHAYWNHWACGESHFYLDSGKTRTIEASNCTLEKVMISQDEGQHIAGAEYSWGRSGVEGISIQVRVWLDPTTKSYKLEIKNT